MKKILKYIIAVILAGSFAVWFLPVIELGTEKLTLLELMKTGFGYYSEGADGNLLFGAIYTNFAPFSWWLVGVGGLVLLEIFLTVVLRKTLPYMISFICSLLECAAAAAFLWSAEGRIARASEELGAVTDTAEGGIYMQPVFLLVGVWVLVLLLSLLGIWLWSRAERKAAGEDVYENPSGEMYDEDHGGQAGDTAGIYPETIYPEEIGSGAAGVDTEAVSRIMEEEKPPVRETHGGFHGAILGENGRFCGMAYPLKAEEESFFVEDGAAELSVSSGREDAVASVYYVEEYAEYCVRPFRRMQVFLESGQPLGQGRVYYLPRGMKIRVKNGNPDSTEYVFTLA